jgi:putative redox protein
LGKRRQSLTAFKISVHGTRPEHGYPKSFSSISIQYRLVGKSLDEKCVAEAVGESIQKYCGVAATIDGRAKIHFGYEIVDV